MNRMECALCNRGLVIGTTLEMIPQIECQVCKVPAKDSSGRQIPLRLCLNCFCNSTEHPLSHPYSVPRDSDTIPSQIGQTPSSRANWSQRQDFALLHGIEKLGFGNWEDISSESLRGAQSPTECRLRFEYLRELIGETPFVEEDRKESDRLLRIKAEQAKHLPGAQLQGYLPLREEFEYVYNNDAEKLIGEMIFGKDDEDEFESGQNWNELKLRVLKAYNHKVDVRESRKQFVLQKGLLDFGRIQEARKRLNQPVSTTAKTSSEVMATELETLSRFSSVEEHQQLEKGLVMEQMIRDEIRKLQQYRVMGIRTFDEIEAYSQLAARRYALRAQQQQQQLELGNHPPSAVIHDPSHMMMEENVNGNHKRIHLDERAFEEDASKSMLTEDELYISRSLQLTPSQYIVVKESILAESMRHNGCVSTKDMLGKLTLELTVVDKMLDFFVRCEWIKRIENDYSDDGSVLFRKQQQQQSTMTNGNVNHHDHHHGGGELATTTAATTTTSSVVEWTSIQEATSTTTTTTTTIENHVTNNVTGNQS